MSNTKRVYLFGNGKAEGNTSMKNLLGGKGANLAEMNLIGIPVPAGFTITADVCAEWNKLGEEKTINLLKDEVENGISQTEEIMNAKFGDNENPLLISVRSGARVSMPGMMDTVLNLGMNDAAVEGLAKKTGNARFAWDSYRRFVQMYGDVVLDMKPKTKEDIDPFEEIIEGLKKEKNIKNDTDLTAEDLKVLVNRFKSAVKEVTGKDFPDSPWAQLWGAIGAVFGSWDNPRAIYFRNMNKFSHDWGTAVNVQAMVYGNMGNNSATGVAFTRDSATNHYKDMQDIEFTIQNGKLWLLQTRTGKRTGAAMVRMAIEMLEEKFIDEKTALLRVEPNKLDELLHPVFNKKAIAKANVLAKGLPASPGAATGQLVFFADEAGKFSNSILARIETSPEDLEGMNIANGILTARGGMTSHAAVVARGMGKCCIAGAGEIKINYKSRTMTIDKHTYSEGDWISLNGSTGEVYEGQIETIEPELSGNFEKLMLLCDKHTKMYVRTNADSPNDAKVALKFGAQGIGLCRTEHMFFEGERIKAMREMILAENLEGRESALEKILPFQRSDFEGIFTAMTGYGVTVRLLDPPLHEFIPHEEKNQREMADEMGITIEEIKAKVEVLHEFNPMLGHRGCRLGNTYPEITAMQARAIIEAAINVKEAGFDPKPEIMVPLIGTVEEFKMQADIINATAKKVFAEKGTKVEYLVGTMIEIPRAALTADIIGKEAEFFSFGTNDLTQMTYGYSRDDAGTFLPIYIEKGILKDDPFQVLDQSGVGQLVEMATKKGRSANPNLKVGICGEHGGEPKSVKFCHNVGMHYVSCSPYRVPIARLAAAQAVLEEK